MDDPLRGQVVLVPGGIGFQQAGTGTQLERLSQDQVNGMFMDGSFLLDGAVTVRLSSGGFESLSVYR